MFIKPICVAIRSIAILIAFTSSTVFADQNSYQSDKEARWAIQKQANVLTDSDIVLLNRAALEVFPNNGTITNPSIVVGSPTMGDFEGWLQKLPPSQSKPITQQLANASPASVQKILGEAYLAKLPEFRKKLAARETFCGLSDGLGPINFDGKNYTFPVGIFNYVGYEHDQLYILQNGKQFRNTPAQLVSDADYNRLKSYTTNPKYVFRVCWKDVPGHFISKETREQMSRGYMLLSNYALEIVGNFEIYDTEARKSVFTFPNNWFFY